VHRHALGLPLSLRTLYANRKRREGAIMRSMGMVIAMACALIPQGAWACETIEGNAGQSPLHTRKPLLGEEARLTSGFGMRVDPILGMRKMHTGVDWAAPIGTPVLAAAGGRVTSAGVEGELGKTVRIDHGAGWQTVYAHLSAIDVGEGDCVAALSVIGKVGSTGLASGPILHLEVRADGQPLDPLSLPSKASAR
jgi:murein DD-endopeptidase MepM/ murein hydrolase activator NlpD